MTKLKRSALRSLVLGGLALAAVGVCHLALTDIWHGEGDLTLEWRMLQFGFLVIVGAQISAIVTMARVMRSR